MRRATASLRLPIAMAVVIGLLAVAFVSYAPPRKPDARASQPSASKVDPSQRNVGLRDSALNVTAGGVEGSFGDSGDFQHAIDGQRLAEFRAVAPRATFVYDLSSPGAYARQHIPGAINITFQETGLLPGRHLRDENLVFVCD